MVANHSKTFCCRTTMTGLFLALVFLASFNCVSSSYSLSSFYSSPDEYDYTRGRQLSPLWRPSSRQGRSAGPKFSAPKRSADLDLKEDPNQNMMDDYDQAARRDENEVIFNCASPDFTILQTKLR